MKSVLNQIKRDLVELNEIFDYTIIRNYEFFFNMHKDFPYDLDLFTFILTSSQRKQIVKKGYFLVSDRPYRTVFVKFFPKQKYLFFLDIHKKNLTGNAVSYGIERAVLANKEFKQGIPISKNEYYLASLLLRGLMSGGFKDVYSLKIADMIKSSNLILLTDILSKPLGRKDAKKVVSYLKHRDFRTLKRKKSLFKYKFILKNLLTYIRTLISLESKKPRIIAVVGMDGSGKTTVTKECYSILKKNGARVKLFYFGRGGENILPIQKPAGFVKQRATHFPRLFKTLIYSTSAFIYTLDFLLRYSLFRKRKYTMVIGDRFSSDILLMPNVPRFLRRALYAILPKVDLYVYLYSDLRTLRKRRGHDLQDLKRQEEEFKWVNPILKSKKIKNNNLEETVEKVLKLIFRIGQPTNSE